MHTIVLSIAALTLINLSHSATKINGIWTDDFKSDPTQANGWNIYNELTGHLNNPTIQGFGTRQYHGAFTKRKSRDSNWMQRQFQCSTKSDLYVSFKYAFCRTENADTLQLEYMSNTEIITKKYDIDSYSGRYAALKNIGGSAATFDANARDLHKRCDERDERWQYHTVSDLNLGVVGANAMWQLGFKSIFSSSSEYALIFDIIINCDSLAQPTPKPITPTLPPLKPTQRPTNIPTRRPSMNPTKRPTQKPSVNPTTAPTFPPIPVGFQRGAHGQLCPIIGKGLSENSKCLAVTDVVSSDNFGHTECLERNDCCMCKSIECGVNGNVKCDTVRIGHYAAFGVRDVKVIGNDVLDGAVIECLGTESCRESAISADYVAAIDCDGVRSCKNAEIIVTNPSDAFALECAGIESCYGLKLQINTPSRAKCSDVIALSRITCESDKSCEGLEIIVNNEGCNDVVIDSVTCTQIGSCRDANFIIGNDVAINSFVCTAEACPTCFVKENALSVGSPCDEFVNGVSPISNGPVVIIEPELPQVSNPLQPKPTPRPTQKVNTGPERYCCLTTIPNFEPWQGYCWGNFYESECLAVPNDRCKWDCANELPKPNCLFRSALCFANGDCCSDVCVFDTSANQRGTCR